MPGFPSPFSSNEPLLSDRHRNFPPQAGKPPQRCVVNADSFDFVPRRWKRRRERFIPHPNTKKLAANVRHTLTVPPEWTTINLTEPYLDTAALSHVVRRNPATFQIPSCDFVVNQTQSQWEAAQQRRSEPVGCGQRSADHRGIAMGAAAEAFGSAARRSSSTTGARKRA